MTSKIYNLFLLLAFLSLNKGFCITIYHEKFTDTDKGIQGSTDSEPVINLENTPWNLNFSDCYFQNESDYIKIVSTSGGRFEAKDINGEAIWSSPWIHTSGYRNLHLSYIAKETGSGKNEETKYLKVFLINKHGKKQHLRSYAGNWGTTNEELFIEANDSLQIEVRISTHYSSDKVILDEVRITGETIVIGHDNDSHVFTSTQIIQKQQVSISDTITFFHFNIEDKNSNDTLATFPSQLVFFKSAGSMNLQQIDSMFVHINGNILYPDSFSTQPDKAILFYKNRQLSIKPETTESVRIKGRLKKIQTDKDSLQLFIDADSHKWKADTSGSGFSSSFINDIYSNKIEINVIGKQIKILQTPQWLTTDSLFYISAQIVDNYGNIDRDSTEINLEINQKSNSPILFENGTYTWQANSNNNKKLNLKLKSNNNIPTEEWQIPVFNAPHWIFNYSFEKEDSILENWDDFSRSDSIPLSGNYSLKHKTESNSPSAIHIPFSKKYLFGEKLYWQLTLKNGNWNPSRSNRFTFWLAADSDNFDEANGYALGVNLADKSDRLQLCRMKKGKADTILINSNFIWDKETSAQLEVTFNENNQWELLIKSGNKTQSSFSKKCATGDFNFSQNGLQYFFTSSRAGKLWIDNWSLVSDNRAPEFLKLKILEHGRIQLTFSEPISQEIDIELTDSDNKPIHHRIESINQNEITIAFKHDEESNFQLIINSFFDSKGLSGKSAKVSFQSYPLPKSGEIIFNEIMFNPKENYPEFIEVKNTSTKDFRLNSLFVIKKEEGKEHSLTIPISNYPTTIQKDEILAFTTDSLTLLDANETTCAQQLRTGNFPTLVNAGMTLLLVNKNHETIDELCYSPKQHHPFLIETKGVSLEKSISGWHSASEDVGFSTPGCKNSQSTPVVNNFRISVENELITPNGDDNNDNLILNYNLPKSGFLIQAIIFDSNGFQVDHWLNNRLLGTSGTLTWKPQNKSTTPGFYILMITLTHPSEIVYRTKKTFAVSASRN